MGSQTVPRFVSHPGATIEGVEAGPSLRFAMAARLLGDAARAAGLVVPGFRTPPRLHGAVRSIRRSSAGAVVAVQVRSRPFDRVTADMVEGVVAANGLEGEAAQRIRLALLEMVSGDDELSGGASWSHARMAERETQAA